MQFGCCCRVEESAQAQTAGFDFIECPVVSLQPESDEATFESILARYRQAALPVHAFNIFLPRELKIVGPEVDRQRVSAYVQQALRRVQAVGARTVVFGSGGSRNIPDGFPRQEALDQIGAFLETVADVAEPQGITVAIEPLNRRESNVINSVAEGVALARQVNRPAIRVLADFYHMDEEQEPLSHLLQYGEWIAHIHVADTDRYAPGTGSYPYAVFVEQLRQAGYDGLVSVECRWRDFAVEAPQSVQFLRQTFS